jgi:hypothetical protein
LSRQSDPIEKAAGVTGGLTSHRPDAPKDTGVVCPRRNNFFVPLTEQQF